MEARGYHRIELGDLQVTTLFDGSTPLPLDKLLTRAAPGEVEQRLADKGLQAPVETAINTYLIDTGERCVLIDAGAGTNFGPECGKLVENLTAAGYNPEQVDAVLLTHIHPDHTGGLVKEGRLCFETPIFLLAK